VFDYRNLGESDGDRRQHLNPFDQIDDYKAAIDFAETLDEVDSDRIGVWGISYSGGHSLVITATDRRVKAVCSIVPVIDGWENMRRVHGMEGFRALREVVEEDREKRFDGEEGGYIAMSTLNVGEEICTWPFPETYAAFKTLKETVAPRHEHRNTIESVELLLQYSVFPYLPRLLDTPVLMIVADADDLTLWDKEIEAFNLIPTPRKQLAVIGGTDHMDIYSDLSHLDIAAARCAQWLSGELGSSRSGERATGETVAAST
jgi:pimeloyl-ACP methyl ester carboxylesterase